MRCNTDNVHPQIQSRFQVIYRGYARYNMDSYLGMAQGFRRQLENFFIRHKGFAQLQRRRPESVAVPDFNNGNARCFEFWISHLNNLHELTFQLPASYWIRGYRVVDEDTTCTYGSERNDLLLARGNKTIRVWHLQGSHR